MKHRNLFFFARNPLPRFLSETIAAKRAPKGSDFTLRNFLEAFERTGDKDFGSPDFTDLPEDGKGSKKSPSEDSYGGGKRIEGKGSRR